MSNKIQIRRGLKSALPILSVGEMGFCTDTLQTYMGTAAGNKVISEDMPIIKVAAYDATADEKMSARFLCASSTDYGTVVSAFNALPSTGGVIQLSSGTFDFTDMTSPITLNANTIIRGVGFNTILYRLNVDYSSFIFSGSNISNLIFEDFTIDARYSSGGITLSGCTNVTIRNTNILANDSDGDILLKLFSCVNVNIINCIGSVVDYGYPIVSASFCNQLRITDNTFKGNGDANILALSYCVNVQLNNNIIYNLLSGDKGIYISGCNNTMVSNNVIEQGTTAPTASISTTGTNTAVYLIGNMSCISPTIGGTGVTSTNNILC